MHFEKGFAAVENLLRIDCNDRMLSLPGLPLTNLSSQFHLLLDKLRWRNPTEIPWETVVEMWLNET